MEEANSRRGKEKKEKKKTRGRSKVGILGQLRVESTHTKQQCNSNYHIASFLGKGLLLHVVAAPSAAVD